MKQSNHEKVARLTGLALLTAIVAVLQLFGTGLHIGPVPFSLVLTPIVIGAIVYGPLAGAWLGAAFGLIALLGGVSGTDWFTAFLWNASPFWTAATCLLKGALAGLVSGLVYRALEKRMNLACVAAALCCPVVNTGIFALAMLTVLHERLLAFMSEQALPGDAVTYLFTGMIGVNFFVELGLNAILSAAIARIVKAVLQKRR